MKARIGAVCGLVAVVALAAGVISWVWGPSFHEKAFAIALAGAVCMGLLIEKKVPE